VWRLSDLKLLKTANLDIGDNHYGHVSPEEPRIGPDGAVYVQTLGCGIERISNIDKEEPTSNLFITFPAPSRCAHHRRALSDPERAGNTWPDCAGHCNGNKPVKYRG